MLLLIIKSPNYASHCIDKYSSYIKINIVHILGILFLNLPPLYTWVQSLGWEDPLEKGTVAHSSILVWKIPWTEEPGRLQSMGLQRVKHD